MSYSLSKEQIIQDLESEDADDVPDLASASEDEDSGSEDGRPAPAARPASNGARAGARGPAAGRVTGKRPAAAAPVGKDDDGMPALGAKCACGGVLCLLSHDDIAFVFGLGTLLAS